MTSSDQELLQQVLPRYDIRAEIGRGGWGVVYEGWHRDLKRPVAIKQLPHQLGSDPSVRDRFIAEAQRVASLEHPHIVPVYDFAERDGLYVIVMELASGGTVWQRFSNQGMAAEEAVGTVLAATAGLHHAHSRGLLHRDVKPDNMLYSASGTVKIADFGIAKSMNGTQAGRPATEGVIGTPAYMAPEQVTGEPLSAATDVYALASVLYELLSGHLPFAADADAIALLFKRVHEPPRPLQTMAPTVSPAIASVVDRALQRDPSNRPADAEQFAVELATAATQSFGAGWLERSAITVMGSTAVIAATERTSRGGYSGDSPSATVVIHPDETARLRLGGVPSNQPSPVPAQNTVASGAVNPSDLAPADSAPVATKSTAIRRWILSAGAATATAAIIVTFVVFGGSDGSDQNQQPGEETSAVTAVERAAFVDQCEVGGVASERCVCAVDRGIDQLDAELFRTGLAVMLDDGLTLVPEFTELFNACIADGF